MRYIQELHEGSSVKDIYLCKKRVALVTKNGKNYESLKAFGIDRCISVSYFLCGEEVLDLRIIRRIDTCASLEIIIE